MVSYGGVSAETRATQKIKKVVTTLKMTPGFEAVSIPFVQQFVDDNRRLLLEGEDSGAGTMGSPTRWETVTTSADADEGAPPSRVTAALVDRRSMHDGRGGPFASAGPARRSGRSGATAPTSTTPTMK
ncbi:hypothetical protein [Streptomyces sp. NPDC098101]|uniref:hypothetical protein n=1 Tax=Streptomyces sp. NPDC098101 TaxID=3366096 RepID=UPI00381141A2